MRQRYEKALRQEGFFGGKANQATADLYPFLVNHWFTGVVNIKRGIHTW